MPVLLDISDEGSVNAAAAAIASEAEQLAGLVNNAGIAIAGPLEFLPINLLRRQFEVNVIGQIAVIQALLPLLRRGGGRIVNLSSMEGRLAMPFVGPYCASKSALEALTESLRMELCPWGIKVILVEPGVTSTQILERSINAVEELINNLSPEDYKLYDEAICAGRKAAGNLIKSPIPAEMVAKTIVRALTVRKPKTRYTVGRDARMAGILGKLAPDGIRERIIMRWMGLPDKIRDEGWGKRAEDREGKQG
jgi:NAD(P)-dependent dehydrogenase (short-subunit alcohol dehydrogenase family)